MDKILLRSQAIIFYNQVLNYLEKDNQDEESLYNFRAITDQHGPLKKSDPNYNGSLYNVIVEWETGDITEEPLSIIAQDDPVTCAACAKEHNLLHLPEWNKLKHIAKHQKTLTRAINQTKIRQVSRSVTYQFGYLVPRDYKDALELDKLNAIADDMMPPRGNWIKSMSTKSSMTMEEPSMTQNQRGSQMHLKDTRKSKRITNAPQGYQKIKVHLGFAGNHDGCHKARLVAGAPLTHDPIDSIYSGVVSTKSLSLSIFLAKLNTMKVWG